VRRIVVLGGLGFFGAAVVERLRASGMNPLVGSRREGAGLRVDVEDPESIKAALRPEDVIVDAAGPFQHRTLALVYSAIETGFDLIDLSDSLDYALRILALRPELDSKGIRVLTSCSSVSAVTAALVRWSRIAEPLRVTTYLIPAVRFTANRGAAVSLLRSVGHDVRVRRNGRLEIQPGWRESRTYVLPEPIGNIRAHLFESSDSVLLTAIWPSLSCVDLFVDSNVPCLNQLLGVAARVGGAASAIARVLPLGLAVVRRIGRRASALAVEVEGSNERVRLALLSSGIGHYTAAVPSAMAAKAIAEGRFDGRGLILPDQYVNPADLIGELRGLGIQLYSGGSGSSSWKTGE